MDKNIKIGNAQNLLGALMRLESDNSVGLRDEAQFKIALNISAVKPTVAEYERQANRIAKELSDEHDDANPLDPMLMRGEIQERDLALREVDHLFSGLVPMKLADFKTGKGEKAKYVAGLSVLAPIIEDWEEERSKVAGDSSKAEE